MPYVEDLFRDAERAKEFRFKTLWGQMKGEFEGRHVDILDNAGQTKEKVPFDTPTDSDLRLAAPRTAPQGNFMEDQRINEWLWLLKRKKQLAIIGPPNSGKKFIAQDLARLLLGPDRSEGRAPNDEADTQDEADEGIRGERPPPKEDEAAPHLNRFVRPSPGPEAAMPSRPESAEADGAASDERLLFVRLHANLSYEEFVCGYRPTASGAFEMKVPGASLRISWPALCMSPPASLGLRRWSAADLWSQACAKTRAERAQACAVLGRKRASSPCPHVRILFSPQSPLSAGRVRYRGLLIGHTPFNRHSTSTNCISAQKQCVTIQDAHLRVPEPKRTQACGVLGRTRA